jgi:hypothetical protein
MPVVSKTCFTFSYVIRLNFIVWKNSKATIACLPNSLNLLELTRTNKVNGEEYVQLDNISLKQSTDENDDNSSASSSTLISLNDYDSDNNKNDDNTRKHTHRRTLLTSRQIKLIIVSFGMRLIFTSASWDYFVNKYQNLLHNYSNNIVQRVCQILIWKLWLKIQAFLTRSQQPVLFSQYLSRNCN